MMKSKNNELKEEIRKLRKDIDELKKTVQLLTSYILCDEVEDYELENPLEFNKHNKNIYMYS